MSKTLNSILNRFHDESVTIGRIIKSHGLRGELWVEPFSDIPSRLIELTSVLLEKPDGASVTFTVENARIQKGMAVLKLSGVDDRTSADNLRGSFITVGIEEIQALDQDSYYIFELKEMEVFDTQDVYIGKVTRIEEYPASAVLVITSDSEEILLPAVKEFIVSVDTENRRLTVKIPEGLPVYPIKGKG